MRKTLVAAFSITATVALLAQPSVANAGGSDQQLRQYAKDTWQSLEAMTDDRTGLTADNIEGDLTAASGYTSPTNIGGYLWSTVTARDLGLISKREAAKRVDATLDSLASMEKHEPSGMFYNWYSPTTGEKLTTFPASGDTIYPFLSTVDNGWLATALRVVSEAVPSERHDALALYDAMDFSWFHDLDARPGVDLNRGGFWVDAPGDTCTVPDNYGDDGADVFYTCHWYDTTVSEARIATYIGIAKGDIPATAYYSTYRTMPDVGCDFGWQEQKPTGVTRDYLGVSTFEGTYDYRGIDIVPSWGGSMFEALMPDLFVPEADWGPRSWGVNHPATVEAQIEHGMNEAGYGAWGFSPASDPFAEYREYGVEGVGINSDGYWSDVEKTNVDVGYSGCRDATNPTPDFGDGVVTPHAAFLALPYDKRAVLENLRGIRNLGGYGPGGFYDAIAVGSDTVAERYLSLDQSMIMAAIGNELTHDSLKGYFVDRALEKAIKPLVARQVFGNYEAGR